MSNHHYLEPQAPRFNLASTSLTVLVAALLSANASAALSQVAPVLEEIVVTATRREVGMQDVPIALSVMEGDKIRDQGVTSLADLAAFMPNVHIAEAGSANTLFIRGVGSGLNWGFEQSVGTFIDGVYFGRGQASRSTFLDVVRVEVLKGPQSTLFGKNTVAGAINITTARPGDEFEAIFDGTLEPEFDGWSTTATLSGPVTDTLGARLVLTRRETDGYMRNTFQHRDEREEKNSVGRLVLAWEATDTLDLLFKYEHGDTKTTGRQQMISVTGSTALDRYRAADPNFVARFDYNKSEENLGGPRSEFQYQDSNWDIFTLTAQWDIGEHSIKSITGYVNYEWENFRDADFSPLKFLANSRDEQHQQFTQEFLLSSPTGGSLEYLAGIYYQKEDLTHDGLNDALLSAIGLGTGNLDSSNITTFDQDAETLSAFGQITWNLRDELRLIGGLRFSHDEKEFSKSMTIGDIYSAKPNQTLAGFYDGVLDFLTDHAFGSDGSMRCVGLAYVCTFDSGFDNVRTEDHWTGDITVQWDVTDDAMAYAKIGNGYKAGGFDELNTRGIPEAAEFEDETVAGIEIGSKLTLWDGRARLNFAVFYNEFDDVQVSAFDGNSSFLVGNAAKSTSQGVEVDGSVVLSESLTLSAALVYLDAGYDSYADAACNEPQALEWIAAGGSRSDCVQDLAGKPLQYAPEWSGILSLDYHTAISSNLDMKLSADWLYSDRYVVAADLDPVLDQKSYSKLNLRAQIFSANGRWSVAVLGKNLTDEKTSNFGNDVPLAGSGFSGTYYQAIDAPRSYELQIRLQL